MDLGSEGFFVANDDTLAPLIRSASRRLIVVAPALTASVAQAVAEKWRELGPGRVSVVLDVDEEPYHIGYGEPEGLQVLLDTAKGLGDAIHQQRGVRIGLVVADDQTLVFSPTPLSVEEAPGSPDSPRPEASPNAILLGTPPEALEKQIDGEEPAIGARNADAFTIRRVGEELKKNPPRQFEITRTERVFNAKLEFVEFELAGAALSRHKAPIPPHLLRFPGNDDAQKILEAHFRLIGKGGLLDDKAIATEKRALEREFLVSIPRFGNVILRENKQRFLERVHELEAKVAAFRTDARERLAQEIEKNRDLLVESLLPNLVSNPPTEWQKFGVHGGAPKARIRELLLEELTRAYGDPTELLAKVRLDLVFKGVTYQTLQDEEFVKQAKDRLRMKALYEEHEAAPMRQDEPE